MTKINDTNKRQLEEDLYEERKEDSLSDIRSIYSNIDLIAQKMKEMEPIYNFINLLAQMIAREVAERLARELRDICVSNYADSMVGRSDVKEEEPITFSYEKKRRGFSQSEAELLLSLIVLAREKGSPYVTVKELATYTNRSDEVVRAFMNRLKRRGEVIAECPEYMKGRLTPTFLKEILGVEEEYSSLCPQGGVEKAWRVAKFNPLNDEEVIEYLERVKPEILLVIYNSIKTKTRKRGEDISFEEFKRRIYSEVLKIKSYSGNENK